MSLKQTEFSEHEAFIGEKELLARSGEHRRKVNNRKHLEQNIGSFEGKRFEALKRNKQQHSESRDRELKEERGTAGRQRNN